MTHSLFEVKNRLPVEDGPGGCWIWKGKFLPDGYPRFPGGARAHREVLKLALGSEAVPKGHHVHHKCETPACVNPEHLEVHDPRSHRAEHLVFGRGLTFDDYREMRRLVAQGGPGRMTYEEIGGKYGVDLQTVYHVAKAWHWPELGGPVEPEPRICARPGCLNSVEHRLRTASYCSTECRVEFNKQKNRRAAA